MLLFPSCDDLSYTKMMQEAPISVAMIANRTEIQALNAEFTAPGHACFWFFSLKQLEDIMQPQCY